MIEPENILQEIKSHVRPEGCIWIAYSGGLDSTVLLHVVSQANLGNVKGIHVNHQLSPNASVWEAHCRDSGSQLGIDVVIEKVEVRNSGKGVESDARDKRYEIFDNIVSEQDIILLGHHRDDLAETFLYRLMRGAGVRGLVAIPPVRILKRGKLLRPLLSCSREELLEYANTQQLAWIEDESNSDINYDRNFLRHKVLPVIQERWPLATSKILKTTRWLSEVDGLLKEYAIDDLSSCARQSEKFGESILVDEFLKLSIARRKQLIRTWCDQLCFSYPEAAQLGKVDEVVLAKADAMPVLRWGQCELRRFQKRLYLLRQCREPYKDFYVFQNDQILKLEDGSTLSCEFLGDKTLQFQLKFRQGGERCQPKERPRSQMLKKLFQEYRLEPWLRDRIPIVYLDGEIAAVGDLFVCKGVDEILGGEIKFIWQC